MVVERKPQVSDHIERYLRYEDFYFEPILKPLRFSWGPLLSPVPPNQVCRSLKNPFWDLQSLCRQNLRSTSDLCRAYAHNLDGCPCDVLIAQPIVQYDETWNVHSWINNKTVVWAKGCSFEWLAGATTHFLRFWFPSKWTVPGWMDALSESQNIFTIQPLLSVVKTSHQLPFCYLQEKLWSFLFRHLLHPSLLSSSPPQLALCSPQSNV